MNGVKRKNLFKVRTNATSKYFMDGLNAQRKTKSFELATRAYA